MKKNISNNDDIVVSVKDLSKSFKLPHNRQNSIKGSLINMLGKGDRSYEVQRVLTDVSFEVKKGDFFGIVGRNGSGKSTLLKLIAGIYKADSGDIDIVGSLVPFIELGVGFNPELTGRENVYLNGALLGFSTKEIDGMYNDIVDFAEIERFMDQKLKNYSSGMQVRLAFSIAIKAQSDILVLDEVLAVGDEAFQRKCYSYFDRLKRQGKTVILVTHDMGAVERFCNKAILVEGGEIKTAGKPHVVSAAYSRINDDSYNESNNKVPVRTSDDFKIDIMNESKESAKAFNYNDMMTVHLRWNREAVKFAGVAIFRENGEYVFGPNSYQDNHKMPPGQEDIYYNVKLNLNDGEYFIKAAIMGQNDVDIIEFVDEGPHFTVTRDYDSGRWGGVTKLDYSWGNIPNSRKP